MSRARLLIVNTLVFLFAPRPAHARPAFPAATHDPASAWSFAPVAVGILVISTLLYTAGLRRLKKRAHRRGLKKRRVVAFALGIVALGVALLSPIDAVSSALFSVHMVQHLLLVVVAAPLLVLGEPLLMMLWSLPLVTRQTVAAWWRRAFLRRTWRVISYPVVAWSLHVVAMWSWHTPSLYDLALQHEWIHVVEHTTFLLTALLFWWVVLDRHRLRIGAATFYLFAAALQSTMLGALITIARHPWYASHYGTTQVWGLSPLEDQQLAGLIMWIPAGLVYLAALVPPLLHVLQAKKTVEHVHDGSRLTTPTRGT